MCSNINAIQLKTISNIVSSDSPNNIPNKPLINIQVQIPNLKQINPNNETSNFEFFKSFISNLLKMETIKEKLQIQDNYVFDGLTNTFSKKQFNQKTKNLNFDNDAVKIALVPKCDLDSCEKENGMCIRRRNVNAIMVTLIIRVTIQKRLVITN
jgi:hypothetical protein